MNWLSPLADEVSCFHPEFQAAAEEALVQGDFDKDYRFVHHLRTLGNPLVPDFVLEERASKRWVLAIEIKRTKEAVFSARFQAQAKSYAEINQHRYAPGVPRYFSISNLETTILLALNADRPPRECVVRDGTFHSGDFATTDAPSHRNRFIADLKTMIARTVSGAALSFETVWPAIVDEYLSFTRALPGSASIALSEPTGTSWPVVRDYFAEDSARTSARVFLLRCLIAEYVRGLLTLHGHPQAARIPPLEVSDPTSVARALAALIKIDFAGVIEPTAPNVYRGLTDATLRDRLAQYIASLTQRTLRVAELAQTRTDAPQLVESLFSWIYPLENQEKFGKVQTDPELASILVWSAITSFGQRVIDPCCGDGPLLVAAHDRLVALGAKGVSALTALSGIEAEAVGARLSALRLALRQPSLLTPSVSLDVRHDDMFANPGLISTADVILMNPPFKRYEAQGERPIPDALRQHYNRAIRSVDGEAPSTTGGQPNLFNYYVEFAVRAARKGAVLAIILDNRWYHSKYGWALKEFLLKNCEIDAIIEYPHSIFFSGLTIATSIVLLRKSDKVPDSHVVQFVRSRMDPRGVDLDRFAAAVRGTEEWPLDWTCRTERQKDLKPRKGWKTCFSSPLKNDFRETTWPTLLSVFRYVRRGSLEKEGGGAEVFEFPFGRSDYGPRRRQAPHGHRFQTLSDRKLTRAENERLRRLAARIPKAFRGWALRNSDDVSAYVLSRADVRKHLTLEPPRLRALYDLFRKGRSRWTADHDGAIRDMMAQQKIKRFIVAVRKVVNLTESVLARPHLWNVLREPVAGELIIPRKLRKGHRVHINPFAFRKASRQVRVSSNFFTFVHCVATDRDRGLDRKVATRLIGAFLISSFGQLQFEMEGYNREGVLALEKHHFARIRVFDPRWVRPGNVQAILDAFAGLPYPIATDRHSSEQLERNELDRLFAEEIAVRNPGLDSAELLDEVHAALDEWIIARQP